jgi:type 1 glutamine amidotransferase
MSSFRWFCLRAVALVLVASCPFLGGSRAFGQFNGAVQSQAAPVSVASNPAVKFKEPAVKRVYQRDASGRADIPIVVDEFDKGSHAEVIEASISGGASIAIQGAKLVDGKLRGVPAGGPYTINCRVKLENATVSVAIGPVFVGDLWVLAGQSNMEGVGDLIDVTPPHQRVMLLGMDGKWGTAEEPLHWLVDSPDPVHSGDPKTRGERSAHTHKTRQKGAGLGLPFGVAMVEATGVPVGLVACAHGGTSMAQWNPALREQGGDSLYGSMLRQVKLAGGKVKGVLWYQGESDALSGSEAARSYHRVFADFIAAVRSDFNQPELPFYFVQIGRFISGADPKGWNTVQEAQRLVAERVPNTAVVSVVDLELDDAIHVGTQGLIRAGHRLARIAERELFGRIGATTPTLERVSKGPHHTLVVKFKGVNMGAPGGMAMGRMGRMGGMAMGGRMMGGMGGIGDMSANSAGSIGLSEGSAIGLKPERHIAGFSIRKEDGTKIPLIYEACVGKARDTVVLKLAAAAPPKASLWYGHGLDPYCNLTDGLDMAVPAFGPIALDEIASSDSPVAAANQPAASTGAVKALIITGDNVAAHAWKETTKALFDILEAGGKIKVDVTSTPSKDLTDDNLSKYDVLVLNYRDTNQGAPESRWSDENKQAFLKAVREGKGLAAYHFASSAFSKPNWEEFEKAVAGGWRSQGFHGPKHVFTVKKTEVDHPISHGLPSKFEHAIDELYQNSVMVPGSTVLATAYSDPSKPRGTGKDEPVIWVNQYGKGRVYENVLGHDTTAMADPQYQEWLRRGVIWAATGKVD